MNVPGHIVEILGRAATSGSSLVLVGQLDRKDYSLADKALRAAGGHWDRKAKAHVFDGDAAEAIEPILLTGEIVSKKQEFGQFFTPAPIAEQVIALARLEPDMTVLEPSAGRGALAAPALLKGCQVDCVEIDERNVHILASSPYRAVVRRDFMRLDPGPIYDRVVMNPPFARRADIHHVLHAARFLKPGGRLIAITSAAVAFRTDKLSASFRAMVAERGGSIEALPPGSFKASGTGVNAVIVSFGGAT